MSTTLEKIKHLATLRERLVDTVKRLTVPIKEFEEMGNLAMSKLLQKTGCFLFLYGSSNKPVHEPKFEDPVKATI